MTYLLTCPLTELNRRLVGVAFLWNKTGTLASTRYIQLKSDWRDVPVGDGSMVKRIALFAPVLLLSTVATWQIMRAHASDLTPWKGGGFGMFSTVDQPTTRYLKCYLTVDGVAHPLHVPTSFDHRTHQVKADPSVSNLETAAEKMRELGVVELCQWAKLSPTLAPGSPIPEVLDEEQIKSATLDIELWRYRFDHESNQVTAFRYMTAKSPLVCSDWSVEYESNN